MIMDGNKTYLGDHFVMHRNISVLCTGGTHSVTGQLYFKEKVIEKRSDLQLSEVGNGRGRGELDEGSQKVQSVHSVVYNFATPWTAACQAP